MGRQRLMSKVAIIFGAASGIIGRAAAMRLFTEGSIFWAANADGDRFPRIPTCLSSNMSAVSNARPFL